MNLLSKFSLAVAFSTALFCLLMLSRGMVSAANYTEHYVFMGQDRGGKVVLSMSIERRQTASGTRVRQQTQIFTEREGWVRLRQPQAQPQATRVGGPAPAGLQGGFPGKLNFHDDEAKLHVQFHANRVAVRKAGYAIADGLGQVDWKGRKLEGRVALHVQPAANHGKARQAIGTLPGNFDERIMLSLQNGASLSIYRHSDSSSTPGESAIGGYFLSDSLSGPLERVSFKATSWRKIGCFELPFAWQGSFWVEGKRIYFRLNAERLENQGNLLYRGSRIGLAKGFVKIDGTSIPAFGMSMLQHAMQTKAGIQAFEQQHEPQEPPKPGMSWEVARRN